MVANAKTNYTQDTMTHRVWVCVLTKKCVYIA